MCIVAGDEYASDHPVNGFNIASRDDDQIDGMACQCIVIAPDATRSGETNDSDTRYDGMNEWMELVRLEGRNPVERLRPEADVDGGGCDQWRRRGLPKSVHRKTLYKGPLGWAECLKVFVEGHTPGSSPFESKRGRTH